MSGPKLTVKQRTCLVKAARERLMQLQADYESMAERGSLGSHQDWLISEIICIEAAIRWLWLRDVSE